MSAGQREHEVVLPVGYTDPAGRIHRRAALRKMRGHEEALLYDASLTAGRLVTELLRGCLVRLGDVAEPSPEIVSRLYSADRNYLLVELRRFTLGDALPCSYLCPGCGSDVAVVEDLGRIEVRRLDGERKPESAVVALEDGYQDRDGVRHAEIRLRLPRGDDEELVAETAAKDPLRARDALILRCIELFGTLPRKALEAYGIKILRDLTLGDRKRIYRALDTDAPGVDFRRPVRCPACALHFEVRARLGGATRLREEIFYLAYHLHWSRTEIMSLDISERQDFVRMLAERIEAENKAAEELGELLRRR
jgi:hypothetical protein